MSEDESEKVRNARMRIENAMQSLRDAATTLGYEEHFDEAAIRDQLAALFPETRPPEGALIGKAGADGALVVMPSAPLSAVMGSYRDTDGPQSFVTAVASSGRDSQGHLKRLQNAWETIDQAWFNRNPILAEAAEGMGYDLSRDLVHEFVPGAPQSNEIEIEADLSTDSSIPELYGVRASYGDKVVQLSQVDRLERFAERVDLINAEDLGPSVIDPTYRSAAVAGLRYLQTAGVRNNGEVVDMAAIDALCARLTSEDRVRFEDLDSDEVSAISEGLHVLLTVGVPETAEAPMPHAVELRMLADATEEWAAVSEPVERLGSAFQ